jgi:hypothetical protein
LGAEETVGLKQFWFTKEAIDAAKNFDLLLLQQK